MLHQKSLTGYTTTIKLRAKRVHKFNAWSSESSSRYSAGHISGLVDNPWPNLTKVGPSRVNVSLSSRARILLFWSSTPLFWSNNSFNPNKPTAPRTWRALPTTYKKKGSNQFTKIQNLEPKKSHPKKISRKRLKLWEKQKKKEVKNLDGLGAIFGGHKLRGVGSCIGSTSQGSSLSLNVISTVLWKRKHLDRSIFWGRRWTCWWWCCLNQSTTRVRIQPC